MSRGNLKRFLAYIFILSSLSAILLNGCLQTDIEQLPPPQDVVLKPNPAFSKDIKPILDSFCVKCHNPQDAHKGLSLDTYEGIMKGHKSGPVLVPGQPQQSTLLIVIKQDTPPASRMPFHQETLTPHRIHNIENWILQGAPNN